MARFDLHLHSNNSDGSDSVENLCKKIKEAGIETFALTDHDTVDGIESLLKLVPKGFRFIPGIELTCKFSNGLKCHLLGYNIDYKNNDLINFLQKGKLMRRKKLDTRINYLNDIHKIKLTDDELNWLYSRHSVVKTHLANILVKRGLADDNLDAMRKFLDDCPTGNTRFDGEEAVSIITKAGGIPVWAHPLGGEGEEHSNKNDFISELDSMVNYGIKGLECFYSRYDINEVEFLKNCARKYDLLITGGSDYHGSNKTVKLGYLNDKGIQVDDTEISSFLNSVN